MPRERVTPLWPIALAPARLADVLQVHRSVIDRAIAAGDLTVFQHGSARRILIADVVLWIKTTWKLPKQRRRRRHVEVPQ